MNKHELIELQYYASDYRIWLSIVKLVAGKQMGCKRVRFPQIMAIENSIQVQFYWVSGTVIARTAKLRIRQDFGRLCQDAIGMGSTSFQSFLLKFSITSHDL
ncbi:hypothetical protein M758_1G296600 [Ceratodon purpureus]|nr:hypothetical protein M758_1G296600 [Ceratodon purpureus]